jgi:hypothetical protein
MFINGSERTGGATNAIKSIDNGNSSTDIVI